MNSFHSAKTFVLFLHRPECELIPQNASRWKQPLVLQLDVFVPQCVFIPALSLQSSLSEADVKHYLPLGAPHPHPILSTSPSKAGPASWVERTLMCQILNYSWNIWPTSRVCCSLLQSLKAHETSPGVRLCHVSEEGQVLQFGVGVLKAISVCISVSVHRIFSAFFFPVCWKSDPWFRDLAEHFRIR